jgi:aminoglycoside phosphotransferase (APT) family kinase protein
MTAPRWRGRPPETTLRWVATSLGLGSRVVSVRLLGRGGWHVNHALTVVDGRGARRRLVLRRWGRPGWELDDPDFSAAREVRVLGLLERFQLPTPRLIAADPDASVCDVPALLATRLPGQPPLRIADMESFLRQLAEMLARIHDVDPDGVAVPPYRTYVDMAQATIPAWLEQTRTWSRAIDAVRQGRPTAEARFIHRDYHPENSLWVRGRLSGVVDWTQASIGPPDVDVGHMRWNLAANYGPAAADRFRELYEGAIGRRLVDLPRWDLVTLLDLVLDVCDPIPPVKLARLEAHAAAAVYRCS